MKEKLNIVSYCHIKNNKIFVDGDIVFSKDEKTPFSEFSKALYNQQKIAYTKFFKMDNLCKLAFITSEILLNQSKIDDKTKESMGIILSNKSASLDTDRRHQETINDSENYFPSPSIFVYTLPNITIGEISIRHQIKGENSFFVSYHFNETLFEQYTSCLLMNNKSTHVLCGWVNFDNDNYDAFMYIVAQEGTYQYSKEFIKNTYNKN